MRRPPRGRGDVAPVASSPAPTPPAATPITPTPVTAVAPPEPAGPLPPFGSDVGVTPPVSPPAAPAPSSAAVPGAGSHQCGRSTTSPDTAAAGGGGHPTSPAGGFGVVDSGRCGDEGRWLSSSSSCANSVHSASAATSDAAAVNKMSRTL
jgi:hypothetical protein